MVYGTGGPTGRRDMLRYLVWTADLGLLSGWKLMDVRKDLLMKWRRLGVMVGPLVCIGQARSWERPPPVVRNG